MTANLAVRVPASSANLGAGFDVLALALDDELVVGTGAPPPNAQTIDEHHPAARAFAAMPGDRRGAGELWMQSSIPMGRGLGFSGAARVGGAALAAAVAAVADGVDVGAALDRRRHEVLAVAAALEGHGDNAAASACGGVVAWLGDRALALRVGPRLRAATVVAWVPDVVTSTDRSRSQLPQQIERGDVVHNLARVAQFVLAVERDDPALLAGATDDRVHQRHRLGGIHRAQDALDAAAAVGAWCGWLSGSGPSVAVLCDTSRASAIAAALPGNGHTKLLAIAPDGVRLA